MDQQKWIEPNIYTGQIWYGPYRMVISKFDTKLFRPLSGIWVRNSMNQSVIGPFPIFQKDLLVRSWISQIG